MKYIHPNWRGKMENVGKRVADFNITIDNRTFDLNPHDKGVSFSMSIISVFYFCNIIFS